MTTPLTSEEPNLDLAGPGPWQPLPNEATHSYTAFTKYLELGLDATLEQVAQVRGRSLSSVCGLSARHHWMDRAAAYRQHASQLYMAAVQRERARQTELAQMRDQLFRQEVREDHQTLRAICREAIQTLRTDPANAKIKGYEVKGLFELQFRFGKAAIAPTGFKSEGPVPPNPDFEASLAKVYGGGVDLRELIEFIKQAHPGQEAVIDEAINRKAPAAPAPATPAANSSPVAPTPEPAPVA